jgi:hypothetical protein
MPSLSAQLARVRSWTARAYARAVPWLLWRAGPKLLPLPLALYVNSRWLRGPAATPPTLPSASWAFAEQQRLLERSEERLGSIESKGPGLAAAGAVVAGAVGVAISLTWKDAGTLERVVSIASAAYVAMSLAAPIALVGPIPRSTITSSQLETIAHDPEPEARVAECCAQAAADNDLTTQRLSNLQAASRNDLVIAASLFAVWAVIAIACS